MICLLDGKLRRQTNRLLYIDIDHMRIVNELHGFEPGNEPTVWVADLLTTLPPGSLACRIFIAGETASRSAPSTITA